MGSRILNLLLASFNLKMSMKLQAFFGKFYLSRPHCLVSPPKVVKSFKFEFAITFCDNIFLGINPRTMGTNPEWGSPHSEKGGLIAQIGVL